MIFSTFTVNLPVFHFVHSFAGSLLKSGDGAWIGLNDRSSEGKFLWNYNKYNRPTFFAWDVSNPDNPEPNNFNGQCNVENCVEMKHSNKEWNDVVCKAHNDYVCQKNSDKGEKTWQRKVVREIKLQRFHFISWIRLS